MFAMAAGFPLRQNFQILNFPRRGLAAKIAIGKAQQELRVKPAIWIGKKKKRDNIGPVNATSSPNFRHDLSHLQMPSNIDKSFQPTLQHPYAWLRKREPEVVSLPWTEDSVRVPIIMEKLGMMQLWDHWGVQFAVTVLRAHECQVVQLKPELDSRNRVGIQLGTGRAKPKNISKAELTHFRKSGVWPKARLVEFRVTPDAVLPVGYTLKATHFVPGQYVDITGFTIGKGFAGGMKRWNFSGMRGSHGTSATHRSIGSTGSGQTPGRVFKNKKMPGHLGVERNTVLSQQVYKIDTKRNLIFVKGQVSGFKGSLVFVRDAVKRPFKVSAPPPFPTFVAKAGEELPDELVMEHPKIDPFAPGGQ